MKNKYSIALLLCTPLIISAMNPTNGRRSSIEFREELMAEETKKSAIKAVASLHELCQTLVTSQDYKPFSRQEKQAARWVNLIVASSVHPKLKDTPHAQALTITHKKGFRKDTSIDAIRKRMLEAFKDAYFRRGALAQLVRASGNAHITVPLIVTYGLNVFDGKNVSHAEKEIARLLIIPSSPKRAAKRPATASKQPEKKAKPLPGGQQTIDKYFGKKAQD